jgi:AcrR family transcriptional regulator
LSPATAKTSDAEVVACARFLIERAGVAELSMQAVASHIGVRAPSLYKRFANRAELLLAVELQALGELTELVMRASSGTSPKAQLRSIAQCYRRYALAHPEIYAFIYSGETLRHAEATQARRRAAMPVIDAFKMLVGEQQALPAARVLTAFLHGFVSMEIASEFRLGPGLEEAFRLGLDLIIDG